MPDVDVDQVRDEAAPWIKPAARFGYVVNGLVYVVVGLLALQAAVGPASPDVNREEALNAILLQPLGQVLLVFIGLGLLGFALGQALMAFRSPEKQERRLLFSLVNRGAHLVTGLFHASLALAALQLAWQGYRSGGGRNVDDWTALVLQVTWGRWLVGAAGVLFAGLAFYEWFKAYSGRFRRALKREEMGAGVKSWLLTLGRVGYSARGLVYLVMGWFLFQAAYTYQPQQAGGLGQVLLTLAQQPYGPWLLGATGAGFVAFGLYAMLLGRYRDFAV